ncbi:MAPEG family protein [Roseobacteraceae bacterium NS-SX3]
MTAGYSAAILSLLVFVLITLVQSAMVGAAKANASLTPGSSPDADYGSPVYRLNRAHQNSIEIMPAAAIAVFACILTGASAVWVNALMVIFLLTRVFYIFVYVRNVGKPVQGVRTYTFAAGWTVLGILCLMAAWAAL